MTDLVHKIRPDRTATWCGERYCGPGEIFSARDSNCLACLDAYSDSLLTEGGAVLPSASHFTGDSAGHEVGMVGGILVCETCLSACFLVPDADKIDREELGTMDLEDQFDALMDGRVVDDEVDP